jgi:hypothetical protein
MMMMMMMMQAWRSYRLGPQQDQMFVSSRPSYVVVMSGRKWLFLSGLKLLSKRCCIIWSTGTACQFKPNPNLLQAVIYCQCTLRRMSRCTQVRHLRVLYPDLQRGRLVMRDSSLQECAITSCTSLQALPSAACAMPLASLHDTDKVSAEGCATH